VLGGVEISLITDTLLATVHAARARIAAVPCL